MSKIYTTYHDSVIFGGIQCRKNEVSTPVESNSVIKRPELGKILANKDQSNYWSGTGKMMHMMRWSRPDTYNVTHNCT